MTDFNTTIIDEFRSHNGTMDTMGFGRSLVLVHSIGAKSGARRTIPLAAVPADDGWLIAASAAGAPANPAWYHNLRANPQVTVRRGQQIAAHLARTAEGDERARYWALANQVYPGYNLYAQRAGGRVIPVVVLDPIHDGVRG